MDRKFITKSVMGTKRVARKVARAIIQTGEEEDRMGATILALCGDLGSGKTVFVQGFAKELKMKEPILSPTFIIFRKFKVELDNFNYLYHFDLYRTESSRDLEVLEFQKIIDNPKNIVLIEWAEKIRDILPPDTIFIDFKSVNEKNREITIKNSQNF